MVLEYAKWPRGGRTKGAQVAARGLEVVTWRSIGDGGEESQATGCVWAPAPPWRGNPAAWVRTLVGPPPPADPTWADYPLEDDDFGPTVLVVTAGRRGQAVLSGNRRGRYVDRGERWNDPAMREWARSAARRGAPTSIPGIRTMVEETEVRGWLQEPSWVLQFEPQRPLSARS